MIQNTAELTASVFGTASHLHPSLIFVRAFVGGATYRLSLALKC
jgi:hypothetical protein